MATTQRTPPFTASAGGNVNGAALSGAATGVKLSYTVPAGRGAVLRYVGVANFTGAPTVQFRVTSGGATVVLNAVTATGNLSPNISLNSGDIVDLNVSALVAASVFDGIISAEEYN